MNDSVLDTFRFSSALMLTFNMREILFVPRECMLPIKLFAFGEHLRKLKVK